ncbi:MAG: hypothetical protein OYH77_00860 [Pseudomonadota bacterium]|nr:hypothetical protein [Pseudomonadota bacterium]
MRSLVGLLCFLILAGAEQLPAVKPTLKQKTTKVKGKFKVKMIERRDGFHRIMFENIDHAAKTKRLTLETSYVHVGVAKGSVLRLAADVLTTAAGNGEIKQVLLYLPKDGSHSPVWMLSRSHPQMKFTGARLLDMHAPQSDYLLF